MIMHFKTQKERLDYLKGSFEEIIPVEVKSDDKKSKSDDEKPKKEKKSQNKATKSTKSVKEDKKDGKVQAE